MSQIERDFHEAMIALYKRAKAETGYVATAFLRMVIDAGGLQHAKTLLHAPDGSSGYVKLWQLRRLDLSMEALVLRAPWRGLFTVEELDIARRRLAQYGHVEAEPGRT